MYKPTSHTRNTHPFHPPPHTHTHTDAPPSWAHAGSYFETPQPSHYGVPRPHAHHPLTGGMTTTVIHGTAQGAEHHSHQHQQLQQHQQHQHAEALEARLARLAQLDAAAVEPISEDSLWHLLGFDVRACVLEWGWGLGVGGNTGAS